MKRRVKVIDVPGDIRAATKILQSYYDRGWRVVGTLYYGEADNSVILEHDETPEAADPGDPSPE